ncbi:GcrA family cell cycle regulator [Jiella marina]|uniref:GcrA family cell cycle regulator n=1 Tax=Jiella sp. LLJ827 TaxID=2917712 RepID=UPI0021015CBD|nr:GcrA family cell cycle regulator [Jiella sp. LLJ827]MCQ0986423.1 hypothetical protein [Jiella sp. LLJ827]
MSRVFFDIDEREHEASPEMRVAIEKSKAALRSVAGAQKEDAGSRSARAPLALRQAQDEGLERGAALSRDAGAADVSGKGDAVTRHPHPEPVEGRGLQKAPSRDVAIDAFWNRPYTEEEKQRIGELWNEGHSAAQIAVELHRTRNAIIGFVNRHRDLCPPRGREVRVSHSETLPSVDKSMRQRKRENATPAGDGRTTDSASPLQRSSGVCVTPPDSLQAKPGRSHRADEIISRDAVEGPQHHPEPTRGDDDCTLEGRAEVHGQAAGRSPESRTKGRGASLAPGELSQGVSSTPHPPVGGFAPPSTSPQGGGGAPDLAAAPRGASAFAPLPGTRPMPLLERRGCTWPVDPAGHRGPQLFCDAPVSRARKESGKPCWCPAHLALELARTGRGN